MPRKEMDYSRTIIYKIVCNNLLIQDFYVGHTTDFTNRKRSHKCYCNNEASKSYNLRIYQFIRDHGNWENWSMIEIEKFPCNDLNEAKARERYWIETLHSTLNYTIPLRTQKEWREEHTEELKEKRKDWYENNKDYKKQVDKDYYENNKEIIHKKQKEYNEIHKEEIRENNKIYRETHKAECAKMNKEWREKNAEYIKEKVKCECGCIVSRDTMRKHIKTDKHKNFLLST